MFVSKSDTTLRDGASASMGGAHLNTCMHRFHREDDFMTDVTLFQRRAQDPKTVRGHTYGCTSNIRRSVSYSESVTPGATETEACT